MTFQFNLNGVCQNPEVITVYQPTASRNFAQVRLAKTTYNRWAYGWNFRLGNSGQTASPTINHTSYPTREEALEKALDYLEQVCQQFDHLPEYTALSRAITTYKQAHTIKPMFQNGS